MNSNENIDNSIVSEQSNTSKPSSFIQYNIPQSPPSIPYQNTSSQEIRNNFNQNNTSEILLPPSQTNKIHNDNEMYYFTSLNNEKRKEKKDNKFVKYIKEHPIKFGLMITVGLVLIILIIISIINSKNKKKKQNEINTQQQTYFNQNETLSNGQYTQPSSSMMLQNQQINVSTNKEEKNNVVNNTTHHIVSEQEYEDKEENSDKILESTNFNDLQDMADSSQIDMNKLKQDQEKKSISLLNYSHGNKKSKNLCPERNVITESFMSKNNANQYTKLYDTSIDEKDTIVMN